MKHITDGLIVHLNMNNIDNFGNNGLDYKNNGTNRNVLSNLVQPSNISGIPTNFEYTGNSDYGLGSYGGSSYSNLQLDGSDDYILLENTSPIDMSNVTVQMICSIETYRSYLQLFSCKNNAGNSGFYCGLFESMQACLNCYTAGGNMVHINTNETLVAETVYNLGFTLKNGQQQTFINAANKHTNSYSGISGVTDNDFVIGATATTFEVNGHIKLYDFKLYNRVLSDDEILQNYNAGLDLTKNIENIQRKRGLKYA